MKGVPTGTLEHTTEKEEQILQQFREEMASALADLPKLRTKWSLLRFLRARQFNLKKAKLMLENYLEFRRKHSHDAIARMPMSDFRVMIDHYASGYCHFDYEGNLIIIDQVAKSNPEAILANTTEDDVIAFLVQRFERMMYVVMPFLSQLYGKRIERTCSIIDLKGVKSSLFFNGKVREFIGICTKFGQDYYPETLGKCFIVNAPFIFKPVWAVIKLMLDERTVSKIFIESGDGQKVLAKHMDIEKLPPSLGGKNNHAVDELNGPWETELLDSYQRQSFCLRDRTPEFRFYWLPAEQDAYLASLEPVSPPTPEVPRRAFTFCNSAATTVPTLETEQGGSAMKDNVSVMSWQNDGRAPKKERSINIIRKMPQAKFLVQLRSTNNLISGRT
jgi:hypothetical protein